MSPIRRVSLIGVAASLALAPALRADLQQPTPANETPTQLEPGRTVERDISARQVHTFRVALDSGSLVRVAVTQRGIDLVVSIYGLRGGVEEHPNSRTRLLTVLARPAPFAPYPGRGDPGNALSALYYWNWNTEEVLEMIQWMRRYNADPQHTREVKFYGLEIDAPPRAVRVALAYLCHVDPPEARAWAAALADMADPVLAYGVPTARRDSLLQAARRLLARFDERQDAYLRRSSAASWALARQHARILVQHLEEGHGGWVRDQAMAENVGWILQHEGPGAKAILLAHNFHVASNCAPLVWMGCHLRRSLGRDLVIFGFAFNRGGFQALEAPTTAESPLRTFDVGPAPDSSLDGTLAQAGLSLAAVICVQSPMARSLNGSPSRA